MRERVRLFNLIILSILVKGKPSSVHMTPRLYLELDAWCVQPVLVSTVSTLVTCGFWYIAASEAKSLSSSHHII